MNLDLSAGCVSQPFKLYSCFSPGSNSWNFEQQSLKSMTGVINFR
jgi:hypothetical protein